MQTKDISRTGLLIALALVLSYLESSIPAFVPVPGIKAGLANIAVVFALYKMNVKTAVCVSLFKVILSTLLFGSVISFSYSLCGAAVSLAGMILIKKTNVFSVLGVSVCGSVLHNLAQLGCACLILKSSALMYYLPFLIAGGVLSGILVGLCGAVVVKKVKI